MDKICVYTCITGNYDNIKEIENKEKGIDYYCFTNNKNFKSNSWNIVYISDENLTNVELARKIKILGHETINDKYDILVWMDGAITFRKKIRDFVNTYLGENDTFVAFKHGERNNIHDEALACYRYGRETKEKIKKILSFYKKEKYPDDNGLIESTVYIKRPKDKLVIKTMKLWFDMILNYSHRDQLSFNYCIYKTGLNVNWIEEKVFANDWFDWINHVSSREIKKYRVYFGDEDNYNINYDIQGDYKTDNNKYIIDIKIPCDVNMIKVEVSKSPYIIYKNIKVKGLNSNNIQVQNTMHYYDETVFFNNQQFIFLTGNFKKNNQFHFEIELYKMDIYSFTDYLRKENAKKLKIIEDYKSKLTELEEVINNKKNILRRIKKTFNSKKKSGRRKLNNEKHKRKKRK